MLLSLSHHTSLALLLYDEAQKMHCGVDTLLRYPSIEGALLDFTWSFRPHVPGEV